MKKLMLTIAMLFTLTCATTVSAQDIQQDLLTKEQLKAHKAAEKALKKIEKTKADAIKKAKAAEKAAEKAKSLEKKYKEPINIKRCCNSLVFREIQVRAIKCHLSVSRWAQMETIYS